MSFLSTVAKDFVGIFSWLGSAGGKKVVAGVEAVAQTAATIAGVGAPVAKGIALINSWMGEIIKTESLAAAAAQQTGSGTQKAAVALSTMVPQLTDYLAGQGLTSDQIAAKADAINAKVVALLNELDAPVVQVSNTTPAA